MLYILSCPIDVISAYNTQLEKQIVEELSENFIANPQKVEPSLILVGGFQGSGKSSLVERIKNAFELNVISTDSIRQSLINKGLEVSPEFLKYVNNISRTLIIRSLNFTNTIIDANAHSKRIQEIEKLFESENFEHRPIKIFLKTSVEVLRNRVKNRQSARDCYQGTENDLEASLVNSRINFEDYDLIVDTDKISKDEVYKLVENFLLHHTALETSKTTTTMTL
ncbi:MAG: AAA family ATPase [Parachlamydiaceae bacterium]|nr:AAA family ATPase [Parachlamydiaceae bacterium]